MTQIEFINHKGSYTGIKAIDHAESPIVCAGVSAILQGMAGTVMNMDVSIANIVIQDGCFEIDTLKPEDNAERIRLEAVYFQTYVSLKQIEKAAPNDVKIIDISV